MSSDEEMEVSDEEVEVELDLTNSDVVTKYKAAADIANKSLLGVIQQCVAGKNVVDICAFGDQIIAAQCNGIYKKNKKMEKGCAFPTCISVNDCVCHYCPMPTESTALNAGDMVKIDLGVHIDGFIAVVAHTVIVGAAGPVSGPAADVVLAAYHAAEAAVKSIKPGSTNEDVTQAVKAVSECYGVNPVQGVLMHQMKRFVIDGNSVVIGREEADQKVEKFEFEQAQVYTVDVVMSTGEGKPIQRDARTTVFKRAVEQSYRLKMKASRYVFNEVNKRFPTLPFPLRVLDEKQGRMGVVECVKHDLLSPYPVLWEKPGDLVAHFKFTVLLLPSGTVKVTGAPFAPEGFATDKELTPEVQAILATTTKSKKRRKKKKKAAAAAGAEAMETE